MNLKQIRMAIYSLYLTNKFGFKLRKDKTIAGKKLLRYEYSSLLLKRLNINVSVSGLDKVNPDGQYLLLCNHRSIIDPCVIEVALKETNILGLWVSKKELFNSFFYGVFVRHGGSVLLDRESNQMGQFFSEIKAGLSEGASISVFPEGTRNTTGSELAEFKKGSRLIAVKNRLPILPMFIRSNANKVLHTAINKREKGLTIEIEFGDVIDCKDKSDSLENLYRQRFNLPRK